MKVKKKITDFFLIKNYSVGVTTFFREKSKFFLRPDQFNQNKHETVRALLPPKHVQVCLQIWVFQEETVKSSQNLSFFKFFAEFH